MATMRSAVGGVLRRSGAARLPVGPCRFSTDQGGHGQTAQQSRTLVGYFAKKFGERFWAMDPLEQLPTILGLGFLAFVINKDIESSAILAEQKALLAEKKERQKNHDAARRYGRDGGYGRAI
ncbi:hypothetical protein EJB05_14033 [Eragrostis curvula]|uniref:Uncharacterized protein n=1 Tax=Eragrostis curvula TaxID=38414 RepID=A0A5J9VY93_9POAL|nr:hypothetical protein EJB05_14033 [Eragrostis curvula]